MVFPIVTRRWIFIPYLDALNIERIAPRRRRNRGQTRRPRVIVIWISCIPQPDHCFHWSLRILIGSPNAVCCIQRTHDGTVGFPNNPISRPVECVGMELRHWRRNLGGNRVVVKSSDALPKPAGLYLVIESASELPVQFVKVIRQCHHIADDSGARCRLDNKFDTTE